ncbi:MAG: bifunctional (p)ppGpp synthetase/guanosine-3',5'-bis(diphosphate) 3'-pyrophosphohydrolase [Candidatus Marinimicrobia bacterium]|nr:bifunctional (p)ppGpp synthetase/guanosine-3',5'-bis(diphosphate) 3'-pyrophosphohydrolase [Candidatus Neomarinimicrobiota bacterium]MBL7108847.1 bifunctional (p)ppGpp synthetase/guanosine-3',5'-bis(diphosphate) 3'-pyrophosphohydrolase [Candidatus Neomarinimicrobiota bacterium]
MVFNPLRHIFRDSSKEYPKKFQKILTNLDNKNITDDNIQFLWKAFQFGEKAHKNQRRRSGEPYFNHCIETATILAEWKLDCDTVVAGLLHDSIEDTDVNRTDLENEFNLNVAELVEGVSKLSGIKFHSRKEKQAENFMKMFLSVAKDIRVILIKFADRLHNMQTIHHLPLIKQRRIAIETRDVYAALAHRLGMGKLKSELEDLSLSVLDPDTAKLLHKKIKATKSEREKYIEEFAKPIHSTFKEFQIESKIFGRPKHFYSIYKKMKKRGIEFEEIFDLLAIRVIVDKVEECYAALGIIHQIYTPLQDNFKDYIATPKNNGYQSIHTTVFGKNGKMVEVQIRTEEMDKTAEIGVAAHWVYKESGSVIVKDDGINRQMRWLRELVEALQGEEKDPEELLNLLKIDLFQEEIFVFTPRGDVMQLNVDSTPVDFAFAVHSQVGFRCIGAKINSKIVPLNTKLVNGDTVEIITSENQKPNQAWLKFVKTTKAKSHIKRWVKKAQHEHSIKLGREMTEKTLRRLKQLKIIDDIKKSPKTMGFNSEDLIFSAVAKGQITVRDIIQKYAPVDEAQDDGIGWDEESLTTKFLSKARGLAKGIVIDGIDDTMITFGNCCSPIPGDSIIGYVTRGRGVTVHRNTCHNIPMLENKDRFINVEWDTKKNQAFIVRLKIVGEDRKHFLKNITEAVSTLNVNIVSVDIKSEEGIGTGIFILQIRDTKQLAKVKNKIKLVPGLIYLERS